MLYSLESTTLRKFPQWEQWLQEFKPGLLWSAERGTSVYDLLALNQTWNSIWKPVTRIVLTFQPPLFFMCVHMCECSCTVVCVFAFVMSLQSCLWVGVWAHICGGHRLTLSVSQHYCSFPETASHWACSSSVGRLTGQGAEEMCLSPFLPFLALELWTSIAMPAFDAGVGDLIQVLMSALQALYQQSLPFLFI